MTQMYTHCLKARPEVSLLLQRPTMKHLGWHHYIKTQWFDFVSPTCAGAAAAAATDEKEQEIAGAPIVLI